MGRVSRGSVFLGFVQDSNSDIPYHLSKAKKTIPKAAISSAL